MKRRDLVATLRGERPKHFQRRQNRPMLFFLISLIRYNLIIQHETLRIGVLGDYYKESAEPDLLYKYNLKIKPLLIQTTLSGGQGKVARPFSYRQPRPSPALSTISRRCAASTCTGANSWCFIVPVLYINVGQGW